jgi:hypothetical protein
MAHSRRKVSMLRCVKSKYHQRLTHTRNRARLRAGYYYVTNKEYKMAVCPLDVCDSIWLIWPREVDSGDDLKVSWYRKGLRK